MSCTGVPSPWCPSASPDSLARMGRWNAGRWQCPSGGLNRQSRRTKLVRTARRHGRSGLLSQFLTATVFSLAGLLVGCGDDQRPSTPTGPTPVATAPSNRSPLISQLIPDQAAFLGDEVRLDMQDYFSDPDGDTLTFEANSSNTHVATVSVSESLLTLTAMNPGRSDIRVTASDSDGLNVTQLFSMTGEPLASAGLDDAFWRQFAFNDHDCRTPETCREAGYRYTPFEERVLWRLPSPSPNFYLLTTRLDDALVDLLHETIPQAVSRLTGAHYTGSIEVGIQDRRSQRGWVVVEGAGGGLQPRSYACREVVVEFCGWSYVGREEGCIVLNTMARRACLTPSLLMHEVGHALGFYHTDNPRDIMHPTGLGGQHGEYSSREQRHGAFAYTQPRGTRYQDIRLQGFGPVPPGVFVSPNEHGGLVVDH